MTLGKLLDISVLPLPYVLRIGSGPTYPASPLETDVPQVANNGTSSQKLDSLELLELEWVRP